MKLLTFEYDSCSEGKRGPKKQKVCVPQISRARKNEETLEVESFCRSRRRRPACETWAWKPGALVADLVAVFSATVPASGFFLLTLKLCMLGWGRAV